jgi:hydrogenase small subunit
MEIPERRHAACPPRRHRPRPPGVRQDLHAGGRGRRLPAAAGLRLAEAAAAGVKPSVIWLHFQECTGCSESLLRTSHPALATLILDLISLDYHETLAAAAGAQVEQALHDAMTANRGRYVCVVEGAVPVKDGGVYCKIGGRTALEIVREVAAAAAVIAIGSCASWGGVQSADPNPTGASGIPDVLPGTPVVTIPGCPANPYNFLGVVLQYVTTGTLPELDELGRPRFAYARTVHEHCPRRPHFDAGRFAGQFGDEGHRQGWCLYRLGCKGPVTHANCATLHFNELAGTWPIGVGHPCAGCTEQAYGFRAAIHDTVPVDGLPAAPGGEGGPALIAGIAGAVGGALLGAGAVAARRRTAEKEPAGAAEETK